MKSVMLGFLFCLGISAANSLAAQESARPVLDRAIKAHGGASQLAKLRAGHVKMRGSLELTQTIAFTKEEFFYLPDKVREIQEFDAPGRKNHFLLGLNGERGWLEVNGKVQHLENQMLDELKEGVHLLQ